MIDVDVFTQRGACGTMTRTPGPGRRSLRGLLNADSEPPYTGLSRMSQQRQVPSHESLICYRIWATPGPCPWHIATLRRGRRV